jgi:hypothetical protein
MSFKNGLFSVVLSGALSMVNLLNLNPWRNTSTFQGLHYRNQVQREVNSFFSEVLLLEGIRIRFNGERESLPRGSRSKTVQLTLEDDTDDTLELALYEMIMDLDDEQYYLISWPAVTTCRNMSTAEVHTSVTFRYVMVNSPKRLPPVEAGRHWEQEKHCALLHELHRPPQAAGA